MTPKSERVGLVGSIAKLAELALRIGEAWVEGGLNLLYWLVGKKR